MEIMHAGYTFATPCNLMIKTVYYHRLMVYEIKCVVVVYNAAYVGQTGT